MRQLALAGALVVVFASAEAQAHQCYRRVVEPPRYSRVTEEMMVSPAREIEETIPAVTRTVEQSYVVRPARSYVRVIPARYGYEAATVEIAPAHREWRVRDEDGERIGCWVTVPAQYGEVTRRVEVAPAREVVETTPEETATRLVTEVVEPERTVTREIPAQYATRERIVMTSPAYARWAPLDACQR